MQWILWILKKIRATLVAEDNIYHSTWRNFHSQLIIDFSKDLIFQRFSFSTDLNWSYEGFDSQLIPIDLTKVITDRIRDDEESGAVEADWKFAAMVISFFFDILTERLQKQLVISIFFLIFLAKVVPLLLVVLAYIPDICHFFYTTIFWGLKNFTLKSA